MELVTSYARGQEWNGGAVFGNQERGMEVLTNANLGAMTTER
jgi:hypothetical protein